MDLLERGQDPWTFDDLLALPESLWRYEIVDGGLLMTPPAGMWHEAVSTRLRLLLHPQVPSNHLVLGPISFWDRSPSTCIQRTWFPTCW